MALKIPILWLKRYATSRSKSQPLFCFSIIDRFIYLLCKKYWWCSGKNYLKLSFYFCNSFTLNHNFGPNFFRRPRPKFFREFSGTALLRFQTTATFR
ncbi:hypothetical protein HanRHA438_Chr06g0270041 [Helianthus annuus]|nr:hypothetical protein HanRHA438_Chr06g0270041 [Helianthus annuus]